MNNPLLTTLLALTWTAIVLSACSTGGQTPVVEVPLVEEEVAQQEPPPLEEDDPIEENLAEEPPPQEPEAMTITSGDVEITSGGRPYLSYLAAPDNGGRHPGIVLIHSFNGLEEGYRTMTDRFAAEGFVVLAVGWQTYERSPSDSAVEQLLRDSVDFLAARPDVDPARLGLTGFCAGGRYTMLFLPQLEDFKAGVAWYGFPYSGETSPADLVDNLTAPMLIIHGTDDRPSPIDDIYRYTAALDEAGKTYELEVYPGEPHGFMLSGGQLREDETALDAFAMMVRFFQRELG